MFRGSSHGPRTTTVIVVLTVFGFCHLVCVNPFGQRARADRVAAVLDVRNLAHAVETYQQRFQRLPGSLEDLVPEYVRRVRPDPWGNPYIYRRASETFEVRSAGPDKVPGTNDDVTIHTTM